MLNDSSFISHVSATSSSRIPRNRTIDDYELVPIESTKPRKDGRDPVDGNAVSQTSTLGKGAYGEVKLVRDKNRKDLYAMKIVNKGVILQKNTAEYVKREIRIQKRLKHPHIIQLFTYFEDKENVYIVLEYASKGHLFNYLTKKKRLSEGEAFIFFFQTCLGIDYLHKHGITHRDLKPENLLIDAKGNIKITDFGWSAMVDHNNFRSTYCGTPDYMAPEMVKNQPHNEKVDLWSLGILLYEMIHGSPPFQGKNMMEKSANIEKGIVTFDPMISVACRNLIERLIQVNPEKRIRLEEVFKHRFLTTNAKKFNTDIEKYIYTPRSRDPGMILVNENKGGQSNLSQFEKMPRMSRERAVTPNAQVQRGNYFENKPEELKPNRYKTPSASREVSPSPPPQIEVAGSLTLARRKNKELSHTGAQEQRPVSRERSIEVNESKKQDPGREVSPVASGKSTPRSRSKRNPIFDSKDQKKTEKQTIEELCALKTENEGFPSFPKETPKSAPRRGRDHEEIDKYMKLYEKEEASSELMTLEKVHEIKGANDSHSSSLNSAKPQERKLRMQTNPRTAHIPPSGPDERSLGGEKVYSFGRAFEPENKLAEKSQKNSKIEKNPFEEKISQEDRASGVIGSRVPENEVMRKIMDHSKSEKKQEAVSVSKNEGILKNLNKETKEANEESEMVDSNQSFANLSLGFQPNAENIEKWMQNKKASKK